MKKTHRLRAVLRGSQYKYETIPPPQAVTGQIEPKPLYLVMQKQWFDEVLSGRKKIEYRDNTEFYRSRLTKDGNFRNYTSAIMQEGYNAGARRMTIEIRQVVLNGCFEIHLGEIIDKNF